MKCRFILALLLVLVLFSLPLYSDGTGNKEPPGELIQKTPIPAAEMSEEAILSELSLIFTTLDPLLLKQGITWEELMDFTGKAKNETMKSEALSTEAESLYLNYRKETEIRISEMTKELERAKAWNWPAFLAGLGGGIVFGVLGGVYVAQAF